MTGNAARAAPRPAPMKRSLNGSVLLLALAVSPAMGANAEPPSSSASADAAIAESTNAILQGDSQRALRALTRVPGEEFIGKDATYRDCMQVRHGAGAPVYALDDISDTLVRGVLQDYQTYWWHAMRSPSQRAAHEAELLAALRARLGADAADIDAMEPIVQARLEQRGYHAQLGRTLPLRELMLWRRQETRPFDVQLPEGAFTVTVHLLDDFASRGWTAYGRCGRGSAGGWATAEALYAVVPSYPDGLDSEAFRVVFLSHETQHFADQNAFPHLAPWQLEYRAKLVEIALADEVSDKRLDTMLTAQGHDTDSPHPYANTHVIRDLRAKLGRSPEEADIPHRQRAARELLIEDSKRHRQAGAGQAPRDP